MMNTTKRENIKGYAVMVAVILMIVLSAVMALMLLGVTPWVVVGAVAMAPILFALMPTLDKASKQYRKISRKIDKQIDALFS